MAAEKDVRKAIRSLVGKETAENTEFKAGLLSSHLLLHNGGPREGGRKVGSLCSAARAR